MAVQVAPNFSALLGRQCLHGNCHRQGRQHATGQALDDPRTDKLQRRRGHRREQQAEDEDSQRGLIDKLQAKTPGKPLGNRQGNGARREVRRENPSGLVVSHRQGALNQPQHRIGQRQVGGLHVSGEQHRQSKRVRTARIRGCLCVGVHQKLPAVSSDLSGCHHGVRCPVSTSTVALVPENSGRAGSASSSSRRTGTRWTTLTQLPVAFSGGSRAKSDPAPGPCSSRGP